MLRMILESGERGGTPAVTPPKTAYKAKISQVDEEKCYDPESPIELPDGPGAKTSWLGCDSRYVILDVLYYEKKYSIEDDVTPGMYAGACEDNGLLKLMLGYGDIEAKSITYQITVPEGEAPVTWGEVDEYGRNLEAVIKKVKEETGYEINQDFYQFTSRPTVYTGASFPIEWEEAERCGAGLHGGNCNCEFNLMYHKDADGKLFSELEVACVDENYRDSCIIPIDAVNFTPEQANYATGIISAVLESYERNVVEVFGHKLDTLVVSNEEER